MNAKRFPLFSLFSLLGTVLYAQSVSIPVLGCNCTEDSKYNFIVTLANDSLLTVTSKVEYLSGSGTYYLTYKKPGKPMKRLFPRDTKKLEVTDYPHFTMTGLPVDTAWLFNTDAGKINLYSTYPIYKTENAKAFRASADGPLLPLTLDNLLPQLGEDEKAMKTALKGKLHRAVVLFNLGEE